MYVMWVALSLGFFLESERISDSENNGRSHGMRYIGMSGFRAYIASTPTIISTARRKHWNRTYPQTRYPEKIQSIDTYT
jgi:hypothetical protein